MGQTGGQIEIQASVSVTTFACGRSVGNSGWLQHMTRPAPLLLLFLCFCLGSCVSVPLSTMVRMSTFDESDFAGLDANVVRVRITLPQGFGLNVRKSWLGVDLTSAARTHHATFELDQELAQDTLIPGGVFSSAEPGFVYVLRLSTPSKVKFRELQQFVRAGRTDQISIRVVPVLSSSPVDATTVKVWIDLLLSESQGYFTFIDAASIEVEQLRGPKESGS